MSEGGPMDALAIIVRDRDEWKARCLDALDELQRLMGPSDGPSPEDADINAAFPTRSGRHDLYAKAMILVGARQSKGSLVALVNWLLHRAEETEQRPSNENVLMLKSMRKSLSKMTARAFAEQARADNAEEVVKNLRTLCDDAAIVLRSQGPIDMEDPDDRALLAKLDEAAKAP